jgi:single-strand DNA-binding protein
LASKRKKESIINKIFLIGNLTFDPTSKTLDSGHTVCSFTVACNRRKVSQNTSQPDADFFRISAFDKKGEACQKYLSKGKKVAATGTVSARAYEAKDGSGPRASLEVMADDVEFLSNKSDSAHEPSDAAEPSAAAATDDSQEDLPF